MEIYSSYAPKYFEHGLIAIPLAGKSPVIKDWQKKETYDAMDELIQKKGNCNIGLLLGEHTGVIALDIDKEDAIKDAPLSPVIKKGKKGETRFFKYTGEYPRKRLDLGYELLSTGNQTVLPPSIHPETGEPYFWVTPDTLLDFNVNDLPIIPKEFLEKLDVQKMSKTITPSDGTRCNHGSHDKMSEMLVAGIHAGDSITTILNNLLEYDAKINPQISYFVCPGRKEFKTKNREVNALKFVTQGFERHLKNGKIDSVKIDDSVDFKLATEVPSEETFEEINYKLPLPHLRGIGQVMFEELYKSASVKRSHFFSGSILALGSVVLGNRIQFNGILPNLYIMLIGSSGAGKTTGMDYVQLALRAAGAQDLTSDGIPAGDTSAIVGLPEKRERIDIYDEGDELLLNLNSNQSYGKKMSDVYSKLYTSAGKPFAGKSQIVVNHKQGRKTIVSDGACFSPYVTLLIGVTHAAFEQNFNQHLIEKGFGARVEYFADKEEKDIVKAKKLKEKDVSKEVIDFIKMWRGRRPQMPQVSSNNIDLTKIDYFEIPEIRTGAGVEEYLDGLTVRINKKIRELPAESKMKSMIKRSFEKIIRLAIIDAAFIQHTTTDITIEVDNLEWAERYMNIKNENTHHFLISGLNEGPVKSYKNKIMEYISQKKRVLLSDFTRAFQSKKAKENKEYLSDLKEAGLLDFGKCQTEGKTYIWKIK